MGNRVAEINASTNINQWYHVKSQDNIADFGTRMEATERDIAEGRVWQSGSAWLREYMSCWPVSKKGICYYVKNNILMDTRNCKSYSFLMNITARIMLIVEIKSFEVKELTLKSLERAENYWIKQSMQYTKAELVKGRLRSLRHEEDHSGVTRTVAKSRRKFWIIKARRLAQKIRYMCYWSLN